MALPQNPQGITNTDRLLLDAVNAQTQNLSAQSKVLHSVSDNIMKQNKEFAKLRKDIQESNKSFLQRNNSNFSEIKKYFEKSKTQNREQPRMNNAQRSKAEEERGFFKGLVGKLFGPSKYQQKMMDDTAAILSFSELISSDINFIKKQYEDSTRTKERELLAQAIADRINAVGGGGDSGGGLLKGALAGFGTILGATLLGGFSLLGKAIEVLATLIGGTISSILGAIKLGIEKLVDYWISRKFLDALDDIGNRRNGGQRSPAGQGNSPPGTAIPPVIYNEQGKPIPPNQLPGTGQKRLPGGSRYPSLSGPGSVEDIPYRDKPKGGSAPAPGKGGAGAGLGRLGVLGLGLATLYELFYTSPEDIETLKNAEQDQAKEKEETKRRVEGKLEEYKTKKRLNKLSFISESGDAMVQGKDGKFYPDQKTADAAAVQTTEDGFKFPDINEKLQELSEQMVDKFSEYSKIVEEATEKAVDFIIPKIDTLGELDFGNGQKLNLFPNLGTSLSEVLKEVGQETKDLVMGATSGLGDVTTNIVNNVSSGGTDSVVAFPSIVAEEAVKLSSGMGAYRLGRLFQ